MLNNVRSKLFIFLLVVLLNISISVSNNLNSTKEDSSLQLVAILHRHGLRTPEKTWPKDPYRSEAKYWPIGWGELLPEGKRQLYQLGTTFSKRYKNFISEYTAQSVRVNSSDLNRCHMSAGALLAGWFPPVGDQRWSKKLDWQPIPIHSLPRSEDRTLALKAPCPRYYLEKAKVDKQMAENLTSADKKLIKYLTKQMGEDITLRKIETYYATITIEDIVRYKLQPWAIKRYPAMKRLAALSMASKTWTNYLKRMFGGPMIKEVLHHFKKKTEGHHKHKKLFLYSAHDSTMLHVWRALGYTENILPDFGSAIIFELHKSSNEYFVKLLYMHDYSKTEPKELDIPNCPKQCSFEKLYSVTKYMRSVNWDTDCVIH